MNPRPVDRKSNTLPFAPLHTAKTYNASNSDWILLLKIQGELQFLLNCWKFLKFIVISLQVDKSSAITMSWQTKAVVDIRLSPMLPLDKHDER